jgi:hypothetical protein
MDAISIGKNNFFSKISYLIKNFFHKRNTANQKNKIMETSFKLIKNTFYKKKKIFYKRKAIKKLTLLQPDLMKRRNVEKGSLCRMTLC